MSKMILTIALLISSISFSHEGEHGLSKVAAPKGGVMRSLEAVHVELVAKGTEVKIYAYDLELKAADVSKFPVTATAAQPKKKAEPIKLVPQGDHWLVQHDAKGAHRYTIVLNIKQGGHDDTVKWVVEPKK